MYFSKLQNAPLCQQGTERLRGIVTIVVGIVVGLIVCNPLTACAAASSASVMAESTKTTVVPSQIAGKRLIWSDEFDGKSGSPPDPNSWSADVGGDGWGNKQLEYDTDNKNAYLDGQGNLVIETRKDNTAGLQCWYGPCQYTSARINTNGHFSFTYGLIEASIKLPAGQGIWPAFWLVGSNCDTVGWPACGEIDVMENIGKEPDSVIGTVHGPNAYTFSVTHQLPRGRFSDSFHTFAVQWDPHQIIFSVDNTNYATLDRTDLSNQQNWVYDHPFYILLNTAVGGSMPGSPDKTTAFPQKMSVDFVRLYSNG